MKKTGYERNKANDIYYSVDIADNVLKSFDLHDIVNDDIYSIANYYIDKTVAENNARADKLMRQLRRFAAENNDTEIDWHSKEAPKYYIWYDNYNKILDLSVSHIFRNFGTIYFSNRNIANKAMTAFRNELLWYFTEYCDHVVEDKDETNVGCELCKSGRLDTVGIIDDRIWFYGGNSKPDDKGKVKFCPKCGRKLVSENDRA